MFSFQFLPVIVSHHRNKVNVPDAQHTHPEHTFIVLFDKPPRSVEEVDRRVLLAAELLALLIGIHIEVDRRAAHAGVLSHSVAVGVADEPTMNISVPRGMTFLSTATVPTWTVVPVAVLVPTPP